MPLPPSHWIVDPHATEHAQRLQQFLESRPSRELAQRLIELSSTDHELTRELWHWLWSHEMATKTAGHIQSLISLATQMLTPASIAMPEHEVAQYVRRAGAALPLIDALIKHDANAASRVLEGGLSVAWAVGCESTDDDPSASDFSLCLYATWLRALRAANPQSDDFGQRLIDLLLADPWDTLDVAEIEATLDPGSKALWRNRLATTLAQYEQAFDEANAAQLNQLARSERSGRNVSRYVRKPQPPTALTQLRRLARRVNETPGPTMTRSDDG